MRVTDKQIALFFGLTTETVNRHKNSKDTKLNNRHAALKEFYISNHSESNPAIDAIASKLGECLELISNLDASQGNDLKNSIQ